MRNAIAALEAAERGADVPHGVGPPDGGKAIPVALVEAVTIVADEIVHREPALDAVEALFDVFGHSGLPGFAFQSR